MANLRLTDSQQSLIAIASYALVDRDSFTSSVLERLQAEPELGAGIVWRTCKALQPHYFTPPPDDVDNGNHRAKQLRKFG